MKEPQKKANTELRTALVWIILYVVGMSVGESLNARIGVQGVVTAPFALALTVALCIYLRRANGFARIGLRGMTPSALRGTLYCLPLLALSTLNLWRGAVLRFPLPDTVLYVLAMLFVGFLEETLFRGLLFRALLPDGERSAIVISSLTFGLGHIVNLLNGAELLPTLLQLVYAMAIGLMLSVFALRTGCLWPCILFHSVFNALSAFSNEIGLSAGYQVVICAVITLASVGYAAWLWFRLPKAAEQENAA